MPSPLTASVGLDCATCLCALTAVYMPALTAAGILPLPANASATSAPALISESTDVITACTSAFLTPALAAGIDIAGLALLPTQCNYTVGSSKRICAVWCVRGWAGGACTMQLTPQQEQVKECVWGGSMEALQRPVVPLIHGWSG